MWKFPGTLLICTTPTRLHPSVLSILRGKRSKLRFEGALVEFTELFSGQFLLIRSLVLRDNFILRVQQVSIVVQSVLLDPGVEVDNVDSGHVYYVQADDATGHLGQQHIDIDSKLLIFMGVKVLCPGRH